MKRQTEVQKKLELFLLFTVAVHGSFFLWVCKMALVVKTWGCTLPLQLSYFLCFEIFLVISDYVLQFLY